MSQPTERAMESSARPRPGILARYVTASLAMIGGFAGLALVLALVTR